MTTKVVYVLAMDVFLVTPKLNKTSLHFVSGLIKTNGEHNDDCIYLFFIRFQSNNLEGFDYALKTTILLTWSVSSLTTMIWV